MSAIKADPIIRDVREHMARAADLVDHANAEIRAAALRLRAHPDFRASRREGATATLAWWYGQCLESIAEDGPLDEAAGWIRDDLRGVHGTLRKFIRDEQRVLARRAA